MKAYLIGEVTQMNKTVYHHVPLYQLLFYGSWLEGDKKILDCGAGGRKPPLSIFVEHGYDPYGIEINQDQIDLAKDFQEAHNLNLNITHGDLLELPFEDDFMDVAYSFNTIFHMPKKKVQEGIKEMARVLRRGGLIFINLPSTDDFRYGEGEKVGNGEYLQEEGGDMVLHSYFDENEADEYFEGFDILHKEVKYREIIVNDGSKVKLGFVEYIGEKK